MKNDSEGIGRGTAIIDNLEVRGPFRNSVLYEGLEVDHFTQLSENARNALLLCTGPRICG